MARIQVGGAGGAPSNNFIRSLRESARNDYLIGTTCVASDMFLADVDEKYIIPWATHRSYPVELCGLLSKSRPDFLHVQNDFEVRAVSQIRDKITELDVRLYMPSHETIENCVSKDKSYMIWANSGIKVPKTLVLCSTDDLKRAFSELGDSIWLRCTEGGGGKGALPTDNYEFAKAWIDRYHGWGAFTASSMLTPDSITWMSIWYQGELVVAQTRKRRSWQFGDRTLSGVTGITGVAETCSDETVDRVALDSILSIDNKPHGIFSVDMTNDAAGYPNPTEINISRFFTTHYFFTKAGLNFPKILCDIALDDNFPVLNKKINPLPDGLVWIRGMDVEPVLTTTDELTKYETRAESFGESDE